MLLSILVQTVLVTCNWFCIEYEYVVYISMFNDIYVKSGLMVVNSLTTLQQIWVSGLKLTARRTWNQTTDLIKMVY